MPRMGSGMDHPSAALHRYRVVADADPTRNRFDRKSRQDARRPIVDIIPRVMMTAF